MDFNKYQTLANSTAIYPNRGKNLVYTVLGLNEEIGEAREKIALMDNEGLTKEVGDILWYVAMCATELNTSLESVANRRGLVAAQPVEKLFLELYHQSSLISGRAKKILRDHGGEITDEKKEVILNSLAKVLNLLNLIANFAGSSLEEVADINIKKLQARHQGGTLKGDGDNR